MDFSSVTVLVLGDVMLDRFVEGVIDRISPEAPVPVLRLARTRAMPGGAANVAVNVAAMGASARLVGLVGRDGAAAELGSLLEARGGVDAALLPSERRPTICKTRFIAGRQQVVRTDEELVVDADADEAGALCTAFDRALDGVGAVILSDYGKGTLARSVLAHALGCARAKGVPVFVDPKGDDWDRYSGATCITPNLKELARAVGAGSLADTGAVEQACRAVLAEVGCDAVLATRSEQGMLLVERDGSAAAVRARAREVFDVSGAGDTAIATLAAAHASGLALAPAMRIANAASGVVVSKLGTATASLAEVMHELAADEVPTGASGHAPLDADGAAALVAHWRGQGLAVGFTNGCFDILHPGHVALLAAARANCDRLLVALNGDASVRRLKGETRPVNRLGARAAVMAAIRHVDAVASFDDDTPLALIERLRPDVLVKGADYRPDEVVGAPFAGRVLLVELVSGQSTTRLIARVAEGR